MTDETGYGHHPHVCSNCSALCKLSFPDHTLRGTYARFAQAPPTFSCPRSCAATSLHWASLVYLDQLSNFLLSLTSRRLSVYPSPVLVSTQVYSSALSRRLNCLLYQDILKNLYPSLTPFVHHDVILSGISVWSSFFALYVFLYEL